MVEKMRQVCQMEKLQIRWMIRKDLSEVLKIESQSFEFPWTEDDFLAFLRQRNCIGVVAEQDGEVVGFMVYELLKSRIHILNFAVSTELRRSGLGSQMIRKLITKLSPHHRKRIVLEIRETNLPAQLFFRENGFRAVRVLKNYYEAAEEDAYVMQYRYSASRAEQIVSNVNSETERDNRNARMVS